MIEDHPFCNTSLGLAVVQEPIKFMLPEFVSYLGERGVLCVENGRHFYKIVLMNMFNISIFKKCSEKIHS